MNNDAAALTLASFKRSHLVIIITEVPSPYDLVVGGTINLISLTHY